MGLDSSQVALVAVVAGLICIGVVVTVASYFASRRRLQSFTVRLDVLPADLHVNAVVARQLELLHADPLYTYLGLDLPDSPAAVTTAESGGVTRTKSGDHPFAIKAREVGAYRQQERVWGAMLRKNVEAHVDMAAMRVVSLGTAVGSPIVAAFTLSYVASFPGCVSPLCKVPKSAAHSSGQAFSTRTNEVDRFLIQTHRDTFKDEVPVHFNIFAVHDQVLTPTSLFHELRRKLLGVLAPLTEPCSAMSTTQRNAVLLQQLGFQRVRTVPYHADPATFCTLDQAQAVATDLAPQFSVSLFLWNPPRHSAVHLRSVYSVV